MKKCNWDGDLLYSSATASGKRLSDDERKAQGAQGGDHNQPHSDYHKQVNSWYGPHRGDDFLSQVQVVSRPLNGQMKKLDHRWADKWLVMKVFGQLWRPNAVEAEFSASGLEAAPVWPLDSRSLVTYPLPSARVADRYRSFSSGS